MKRNEISGGYEEIKRENKKDEKSLVEMRERENLGENKINWKIFFCFYFVEKRKETFSREFETKPNAKGQVAKRERKREVCVTRRSHLRSTKAILSYA